MRIPRWLPLLILMMALHHAVRAGAMYLKVDEIEYNERGLCIAEGNNPYPSMAFELDFQWPSAYVRGNPMLERHVFGIQVRANLESEWGKPWGEWYDSIAFYFDGGVRPGDRIPVSAVLIEYFDDATKKTPLLNAQSDKSFTLDDRWHHLKIEVINNSVVELNIDGTKWISAPIRLDPRNQDYRLDGRYIYLGQAHQQNKYSSAVRIDNLVLNGALVENFEIAWLKNSDGLPTTLPWLKHNRAGLWAFSSTDDSTFTRSGSPIASATPGYNANPNYQTPPPNYQTPPPNYQTPPPSYQTPPPNYQTPLPSYQTPPPSYQTPPPNYQTPPPNYQTPPPYYPTQPPSYQTPPPNYQAPVTGELKWSEDWNEALRLSSEQNKPVVLYFYSDTVPRSRTVDRDVFNTDEFRMQSSRFVLYREKVVAGLGIYRKFDIFILPAVVLLSNENNTLKTIETFEFDIKKEELLRKMTGM